MSNKGSKKDRRYSRFLFHPKSRLRGQVIHPKVISDKFKSVGLGGCGFLVGHKEALNLLSMPKVSVKLQLAFQEISIPGTIQYCTAVLTPHGQQAYYLGVQFSPSTQDAYQRISMLLKSAQSDGSLFPLQ